jgi:hypothetical protein
MAGMGGQLFLVSGRLGGKIWISVNACLADRTNHVAELSAALSATFGEFGLVAELHG